MFDMSSLTAAIVYSTLGLVVGILVSTGVFYAFTYSKIKHKNTQLRDACLLYQKQLTQLLNKNKALEIQVREARQRWEKEQQAARQAAPAAAGAEQATAETDEQRLAWNQERQEWLQKSEQMDIQLEQLQQERQVLEESLAQANGRWKQERDKLKISNDELQIELAKLRQTGGRTETVQTSGDAAGVEAKLLEQQTAWKRAQQLLQQQIGKLKTDRKALETELVSQASQSEREKQALEDEIEQLSERMMKLQVEQEMLNEASQISAAARG